MGGTCQHCHFEAVPCVFRINSMTPAPSVCWAFSPIIIIIIIIIIVWYCVVYYFRINMIVKPQGLAWPRLWDVPSKTSNGAITPWSPTPGPRGTGCLFLREARALSVWGTAILLMPCTEMRIWVPMDAKRKATEMKRKSRRKFGRFLFFSSESQVLPLKALVCTWEPRPVQCFACETFCRCMIWTELLKTCYKCL